MIKQILAIILMAGLIATRAVGCNIARGSPDPDFSDRPFVQLDQARVPVIKGWLHTSGRQILDADNNAVRLLGVGINGMDVTNGDGSNIPDGCRRAWRMPPPEVYNNIVSWGFNSVRLALAWGNLEPTPPPVNPDGTTVHNWNRAYVSAVDEIIQNFTRRGIAVILDIHQYLFSSAFKNVERPSGEVVCEGSGMPSWLCPNAENENVYRAYCDFFANQTEPGVPIPIQEGFTAAWRFLASRYAKNPLVIAADMYNEPLAFDECRPSDLHLTAFYVRLGLAIREVSPNLLLIYEDTVDLPRSGYGLVEPVPLPNSVYSFHLYEPDWAGPEAMNGRNVINLHEQRAIHWNAPLWIGEFNAFGAIQNRSGEIDPTWESDLLSLMNYCKRQGISWSIWAYSGYNSLVDLKTGQPKTRVIQAFQSGF